MDTVETLEGIKGLRFDQQPTGRECPETALIAKGFLDEIIKDYHQAAVRGAGELPPCASLRTGLEPLGLSGSHHPAVSPLPMRKQLGLPMGYSPQPVYRLGQMVSTF